MLTIQNYVYKIENNILKQIDIKFRNQKSIESVDRIIYCDDCYLVGIDEYCLKILNVETQKNMKIDIRSFFVNFRDWVHNPKICGIADNHIVIELSLVDTRIAIYNLITNEYYIIKKYNTHYPTIFKSKISMLCGFESSTYIFSFNSITELSQIINFDTFWYGSALPSIYWKNSNNIHNQVIGISCYDFCIYLVWIYSSDLKPIKVVNIYDYGINVKLCGKFIHNIAVIDDNIYIWDNNWILIIKPNYNVVRIKNFPKIVIFNFQYGIFINSVLKMFKIIDNKFIQFRFEYDLLYDVNIPYIVKLIIGVLIDLELFPIEIGNVVYQQFFVCLSRYH